MTTPEKRYELARTWQAHFEAQSPKEYAAVVDAEVAKAIQALLIFQRRWREYRQGRLGKEMHPAALNSYAMSLRTAQDSLSVAQHAFVRAAFFSRPGKNPFLEAPDAPETAENAEEAPPVNMEAPAPEMVTEAVRYEPVAVPSEKILEYAETSFAKKSAEALAKALDREIVNQIKNTLAATGVSLPSHPEPPPPPPQATREVAASPVDSVSWTVEIPE